MAIFASALLVRIWRRVVLAVCFLSGISGLLYEVVWARMLHLLFGDTVLAVSTVLASFMAGLAVGRFWVGGFLDGRGGGVAGFGGLAGGVCVGGALFSLGPPGRAPPCG